MIVEIGAIDVMPAAYFECDRGASLPKSMFFCCRSEKTGLVPATYDF
jgi:hypothetical protein